MPALPARVELLGLPLDPLTMDQSVQRCLELARGDGTAQHVVINAAKVVAALDDPELAKVLHRCAVVNADGMSVVWAARALGLRVPERVAGIDLMDQLLAACAREGLPVYLLGAQAEVVRRVVDVEGLRHPGLVIAGHRDGYWNAEQEPGVVAAIRASGARVLFVAMPSPRKEQFLDRWGTDLGVGLRVGVGGSFDVVAGVTRRAPRVLQRAGLEWLYRLAQEPRRLARRYAVGNTRFVLLVVRGAVSQRRAHRRGAPRT